MKRDFLKGLDLGDGARLPDAAIEAIMAEYGKGKGALEAQINTLTNERDGLREQLGTANETIRSYKDMDIDGIKKAAADWEAKYQTDTQALQAQIDADRYRFAVDKAVGSIRFSSESAKRAFMADLTAKKLPVQEGKLLGLEDFTKTYRESDPGAFVPENDDKTPVAVRGGTGGGGSTGSDAALRAAFGLPDHAKKE